jgi:hypothetical protein
MALEPRLSIAIAFFALGCSSSRAPSEDASSDAVQAADAGDAMDCGSLAWGAPACAACTDIHCCSLESLCAAIPSCTPLSQCTLACGADAGCAMACGATYVDSVSNYNAVLNCQSNECPSECAR